MNVSRLKELNITRVLKVNGIESAFPFKNYGIELKVMDIDDMPDFDIEPFFEDAWKFVDDVVSKG